MDLLSDVSGIKHVFSGMLIDYTVAMLSKIGLRTVDVGNPMLSMHSIRETAGSHDIQSAIDVSCFIIKGTK